MVQTIVAGGLVGALLIFMLWGRATRAEEQEAQRREDLAVIVMYAEVTAAIEALDLALRDADGKWLVSMSESRTLSEAWREHGEALLGLGSKRWAVLSEAVTAVAPNYGFSTVGTQTLTEDVKRSLAERRQLLVDGARILRDVHERRIQTGSALADDAKTLPI